jgi:hypothetical protein
MRISIPDARKNMAGMMTLMSWDGPSCQWFVRAHVESAQSLNELSQDVQISMLRLRINFGRKLYRKPVATQLREKFCQRTKRKKDHWKFFKIRQKFDKFGNVDWMLTLTLVAPHVQ